jgi:hypothetical protein
MDEGMKLEFVHSLETPELLVVPRRRRRKMRITPFCLAPGSGRSDGCNPEKAKIFLTHGEERQQQVD